MQAPIRPQNKTAEKSKVWAKKDFKNKLGNQWIFGGAVRKF
jgi:hypothetical protein